MSRILFVLVSVSVAACGRSSDQCAPIVAQGARQFADSNMELLAATLSPGVAADEKVYDRLVRDIQAIKQHHPDTSDIEYTGPHDGRTLQIEFETFSKMLTSVGLYRRWDCLNAQYQVESIDTTRRSLQIKFKNIYDLKRVAPSYAGLPGVKWAEPNFRLAWEERKTICVVPNENAWRYFFERTTSNTGNTLYFFSTAVGGEITAAETWSIPASAAEFESTKPTWADEYWNGSSCKR